MNSKPSLLYLILFLPLLPISLAALYRLSESGMELWKPSDTQESVRSTIGKGEIFTDSYRSLEPAIPFPPDPVIQVYARTTGLDRRMKRGSYELGPEWSPAQVLEQFALGSNSPNRVVLPPGLTLVQSAERLQSAGWIENATNCLKSATGSAAVEICGRPSLEGLIAPETYFFDEQEHPSEVLSVLYRQWKSNIEKLAGTSELSTHLRNGLTLYDTIILASLVEKEAASQIEMATVASVFHNRIRKNWPMGSAATLRYALHDWERGENQLPVNLKSPFNTNRKPGLPPHPICIPSREALSAAVRPADTPYFFFVADGEGGTIFNETHREHIQSARNYRDKIRNQQN